MQDIELHETLAELYEQQASRVEWERAIALEVCALPLPIPCEVMGTGGGCTAILASDGATDVVLTTLDGVYLFGVYRVTEEHPEVHGWYPEQSIHEDMLEDTCPLSDAVDVFAALVAAFIDERTPYLLRADGGEGDWREPWAETLYPDMVEALEYASNSATWATARRVTIIDERTGANERHTFTTQADALASYMCAVGRA